MLAGQLHEEIRVVTGDLRTASQSGWIHTTPLGSCVALVAFDAANRIGGIAHIMLPGSSSANDGDYSNKYANNAINNLLNKLYELGVSLSAIDVCLIGGGNVLRDRANNIASILTAYILEELKTIGLSVVKTSLGGYERRTATLHIETGIVYYSIGNSQVKQLHCFETKKYKEKIV